MLILVLDIFYGDSKAACQSLPTASDKICEQG